MCLCVYVCVVRMSWLYHEHAHVCAVSAQNPWMAREDRSMSVLHLLPRRRLSMCREEALSLFLSGSLSYFSTCIFSLSHTHKHTPTHTCVHASPSLALSSLFKLVLGDVRLSFSLSLPPSIPPFLSDSLSLTLWDTRSDTLLCTSTPDKVAKCPQSLRWHTGVKRWCRLQCRWMKSAGVSSCDSVNMIVQTYSI